MQASLVPIEILFSARARKRDGESMGERESERERVPLSSLSVSLSLCRLCESVKHQTVFDSVYIIVRNYEPTAVKS
jgi:hypothetical protein